MPETADSVFEQGLITQSLIDEQEARNAVRFHEILTRPLRERTKQLAKDREDYCRKLLEQRLPHISLLCISRATEGL